MTGTAKGGARQPAGSNVLKLREATFSSTLRHLTAFAGCRIAFAYRTASDNLLIADSEVKRRHPENKSLCAPDYPQAAHFSYQQEVKQDGNGD